MELDGIFAKSNIEVVEVEFKGVKISIEICPLSWSKKNQILGRCFTYATDGSISFNYDRYMKEALSELITKAPWGETNHIFLNKINAEFGAILEKLVPKAFDEVKNMDFFEQRPKE